MATKERTTEYAYKVGVLRRAYIGGNAQEGGPGVQAQLTKLITGIANNVATAVFTVTVPNAAHAAMLELSIIASLGAGGAVGAFEDSSVAFGMIAIARTPGLATAVTAVALSNTGSAAVAGAAAMTLAYAVSAVSGGNGATQTFTVTVTIAATTGSSTNHQALIAAALTNSQAAGVTIA